MKLINHPEKFKEGTRVLHLLSRNKDEGESGRTLLRVSHNAEQFDRRLEQFKRLAAEGQRIYVSAEPRDINKAIRSFKVAQLDNDYQEDPTKFYRSIDSRWSTALMKPANAVKEERLWLVDCDSDTDYELYCEAHEKFYTPQMEDRGLTDEVYEYDTKSGRHCLIKPFNMTKCSGHFQTLVHKNSLMLWGY